jgi:hypothetical protein
VRIAVQRHGYRGVSQKLLHQLGMVAAAVFMYPLGLLITALVTSSTTPTVLVGALLIVIGGAWMAWSVLRQPSAEAVGVAAQPRVR